MGKVLVIGTLMKTIQRQRQACPVAQSEGGVERVENVRIFGRTTQHSIQLPMCRMKSQETTKVLFSGFLYLSSHFQSLASLPLIPPEPSTLEPLILLCLSLACSLSLSVSISTLHLVLSPLGVCLVQPLSYHLPASSVARILDVF